MAHTGAGMGAGAGSSSSRGSKKRPRTGGDDLVDADAFVAGDSGDEDGGGFAVDLGSGDDSGGEEVGAGAGPAEGAATGDAASAGPAAVQPAQKKRRKKKKKKKGSGGQQSEPDPSLGDAATQAAFFWRVFCDTVGKDQTELERGHPPTPESFIATPSIPHGTPAIAEAIRIMVPSYKKTIMWSKDARRIPGRPQVLVVCSSARRCVQLLKPLAAFKTRVAKLFAKHMDIKQQASLLATGNVTIAVGTPARIRKLADQGDLVFGRGGIKRAKPQVVVFDMTRDAKTLTVLSRHDTCQDAMMLYSEHLSKRVTTGSIKLALF